MKYKEALQIGTRAEGIVQCTFATIFDRNGKALFSLQRKNFQDSPAYYEYMRQFGDEGSPEYGNRETTYSETFVYTADGKEGIIVWDADAKGLNPDNAPTGLIMFDMPLVIADEYHEDRLVPVKLLLPAVNYLKQTIKSGKKATKYIIYRKNEDGTDGDVLQETYTKPDPDKLEEQGCDYRIEPKALPVVWERLLKLINADDWVYVKPAAFRWNITQVRTVANENTDPNSALGRLAAAQKNLDKAKAVLIAAGLSNLL